MSNSKNISKEDLIKYYLDQKLSPINCGKIFGCSDTTITHYLEKYNIPIRSRSEAQIGRIITEEHRQNISRAKMGSKAWNEGIPRTDEEKAKISKNRSGIPAWNIGMKMSEEFCKKDSESHKGQKAWNEGLLGCYNQSEESNKKRSESEKGEKNWNWKGGITTESHRIRNSYEYKQWMKLIYKRDARRCHRCNNKGKVTAHHIINFSKLRDEKSDLLFDPNNGITFCKDCHKQFHSKYGNKNNNQQQIFEFVYLNN